MTTKCKSYVKDYTNKEWQEILEFKEETSSITNCNPYKVKGSMVFTNLTIIQNGIEGESKRTYYKTFISDISNNIKKGNHDFCYHTYHIKELLKLHPLDLRTRINDDYTEVWLER